MKQLKVLEQEREALASEIAAIGQDIADAEVRLAEKKATLATRKAQIEAALAARQKEIAAEQVEGMAKEFIEIAIRLDAAHNDADAARLERLANHLATAGRLRQPSYEARKLTLKRMANDPEVKHFGRPFVNYERLAAAWIKPATRKAA